MDIPNIIGDAKELLERIQFPANKSDIINTAKDQGADDSVVGMLEKLPNQTFASASDVVKKMWGDAKDKLTDIL